MRSRVPGPVTTGLVAATQPPLRLSNCVLWLEAHAVTGLADGAALSPWLDASGGGKDFSQGTAGLKPLYKTGQKNGYAGVYFDATNDTMTGSLSISNPYTIFVVYASNAGAGGGHRLLQGASNNWLMGPYDGAFKFYNGGFIAGPTASAGLYKCQHVVADSGGAEMFINNVSQGSNANTTAPGTLVIGPGGAFAEVADSTVLEIIAYSDKKSTADQTVIYNYLKDKYAL